MNFALSHSVQIIVICDICERYWNIIIKIYVFIGELPADTTDYGLTEKDGTEDIYPYHPADYDEGAEDFWFLQDNFAKILDIITKIKDAGNTFYKTKDYKKAILKYR